jgi:hypothetical protein
MPHVQNEQPLRKQPASFPFLFLDAGGKGVQIYFDVAILMFETDGT